MVESVIISARYFDKCPLISSKDIVSKFCRAFRHIIASSCNFFAIILPESDNQKFLSSTLLSRVSERAAISGVSSPIAARTKPLVQLIR